MLSKCYANVVPTEMLFQFWVSLFFSGTTGVLKQDYRNCFRQPWETQGSQSIIKLWHDVLSWLFVFPSPAQTLSCILTVTVAIIPELSKTAAIYDIKKLSRLYSVGAICCTSLKVGSAYPSSVSKQPQPGMLAHTCHPSTPEVEAGGPRIWGHPQVYMEFEPSMAYKRLWKIKKD